jgi:hypothetical protein
VLTHYEPTEVPLQQESPYITANIAK